MTYPELSNFLRTTRYDYFFDQKTVLDAVSNYTTVQITELYFRYAVNYDEIQLESTLNLIPTLGTWIQGNKFVAIMMDIGFLSCAGLWLDGYFMKIDFPIQISYFFFTALYAMNLLEPYVVASYYNTRLANSLGLTPDYRGIHSMPKPASGNLLQFNLFQSQW